MDRQDQNARFCIIQYTIDKAMIKIRKLTRISSILFIFILPQVLAKVYNVDIFCGTCQSTSGCTGNMCLIVTGDLQKQYCYGSSTCTLNAKQTLTMGLCQTDFSGATCQSGVCATGASVTLCYDYAYGSCLDGVSFSETCNNGQLFFSMYGGIYGTNTYNWTVPFNSSCPFIRAHGGYSRCNSDFLGNSCTCCFSAVFEGMNSGTGSCVPQDSPMVQMKNDIKNFGYQILISMSLILFQILILSV